MSENPLEAAMRRKLAISDLKALLKDGPHEMRVCHDDYDHDAGPIIYCVYDGWSVRTPVAYIQQRWAEHVVDLPPPTPPPRGWPSDHG